MSKRVKESKEKAEFNEDSLQDKRYLDVKLDTETLLSRLQLVRPYLSNLSQQDDTKLRQNQLKKLDYLAAALDQQSLIEHPDKEVRIYCACCLCDIIRLYAPEPPYSEEKLKEIFQLFINQLQGLEKQSSHLYKLYYHLLRTLAAVQAFVLMVDDQEMLLEIFKSFFNLVSGLEPDDGALPFLSDIIVSLLSEMTQEVEASILDEICKQLVSPNKENETVHKFAQNIISHVSEHVHDALSSYLKDMINHSSESELRETAHELIYEINLISPSLLLYVLPNLEKELSVDFDETRSKAVALLSRMFAAAGSSLHTSYRQLFTSFLGRFNDKNEEIRKAMIEFAQHFFAKQDDLASEVLAALVPRMLDADDVVRKGAISVVCELAMSKPQLVSGETLNTVFDRMRDKRPDIRKDLILRLAAIYRKHKGNKSFQPIPSKILCNIHIPEDKAIVELAFDEKLLPSHDDLAARTEALLEFVDMFCGDTRTWAAFHKLLKEKKAMQVEFRKWMDLRGDDDDTLQEQANVFSNKFTIPNISEKPKDFFKKLSSQKDWLKLFTIIVDPDASYEKQHAASTDLEKKLKKNEYGLALVPRLRSTLVSKEDISNLKDSLEVYVKEQGSQRDEIPFLRFLGLISQVYPEFVKEIFPEILHHLDTEYSVVTNSLLLVLSNIAPHLEHLGPTSRKDLTKKLSSLCISGTPSQSRLSAIAFNGIFSDKAVYATVLEDLVKHLEKKDNLGAVLTALGQFAELTPEFFAPKADRVVTFVADLLAGNVEVKSSSPTKKGKGKSNDKGDTLSPLLEAQIEGINLLGSFLSGKYSEEDDGESSDIIHQLTHILIKIPESIRLVSTIQYIDGYLDILDDPLRDEHDGESNDAGTHRNRLKLAAAATLVRLSKFHRYDLLITPIEFESIVWEMQRSVTNETLPELDKFVQNIKVPVKYLNVLVLAASNPKVTFAKQSLTVAIKLRREVIKSTEVLTTKTTELLPEYALPHLVHLLAHKIDFKKEAPLFSSVCKYLTTYFEHILHEEEHFSFLVHLLQGIRLTKDAVEPTAAETRKDVHLKDHLPPNFHLPDMKRTALTPRSTPKTNVSPVAASNDGVESKPSENAQVKKKKSPKKSIKRKLVYDSGDDEEESVDTDRPKNATPSRPRKKNTIKSYFHSSQQDQEEEEKKEIEAKTKEREQNKEDKKASQKVEKKLKGKNQQGENEGEGVEVTKEKGKPKSHESGQKKANPQKAIEEDKEAETEEDASDKEVDVKHKRKRQKVQPSDQKKKAGEKGTNKNENDDVEKDNTRKRGRPARGKVAAPKTTTKRKG